MVYSPRLTVRRGSLRTVVTTYSFMEVARTHLVGAPLAGADGRPTPPDALAADVLGEETAGCRPEREAVGWDAERETEGCGSEGEGDGPEMGVVVLKVEFCEGTLDDESAFAATTEEAMAIDDAFRTSMSRPTVGLATAEPVAMLQRRNVRVST